MRKEMITTENLNNLIMQINKGSHEKTTNARLSVHKSVSDFIKVYEEIKKNHNQESSIFHIMEQVDFEIQKHKERFPSLSSKISCKKKCHFCCQQSVSCSKDEAYLISEHLKESGIKIDIGKIKRQAAFDVKNWSKQVYNDWGCVFLSSQGNCRIYKFRPLVCRAYMSLSNYRDCNIEKAGMKTKRFVAPKAEIIISAIWNISKIDTLPKQLLKTFNKEK